MGKIIYIMGKSSTGKDTIYKQLIKKDLFHFKTIIPYTTRPIREGEVYGVEYCFTDEDEFHRLKVAGKVVEDRCYQTCHGPWRYFTVDDGQVSLENDNYIMIGTLESYQRMREYYGSNALIPILIEVDDGIRLQRALNREKKQVTPKYEEMCRRFLADAEDFSAENIRNANIQRSFKNEDLGVCLSEIEVYIRKELS